MQFHPALPQDLPAGRAVALAVVEGDSRGAGAVNGAGGVKSAGAAGGGGIVGESTPTTPLSATCSVHSRPFQ